MTPSVPRIRAGFTLIELLVVIAIISILAAILFPVFAKVREKARQTQCASNQHQISTAILEYLGDSDDAYPWSYSMDKGTFWMELIDPYLKVTSSNYHTALSCLDAGVSNTTYSTNGQVIGLLDTTENPPASKFYNSVVLMNDIQSPSDTILLGDAILNTKVQPSAPRSSDEFSYPHPADQKDHTNDELTVGWEGTWDGYSVNNKQISWRHTNGANFAFCDGHVKWQRFGSLTDANWDVRCQYGLICRGAAGSSVYPAPDGTCGNQSPIDCQ